MGSDVRFLLLTFLPALLGAMVLQAGPARAGPARAGDVPRCTPEISGAVVCMAGRSCLCGFMRGGLMAGLPDGWRWDCGILRGGCGPPSDQQAEWLYALPPGLSVDQSDHSIRLDQNSAVNTGGQQNIGRPEGRGPEGRGPHQLFPGWQQHDPPALLP